MHANASLSMSLRRSRPFACTIGDQCYRTGVQNNSRDQAEWSEASLLYSQGRGYGASVSHLG